MSVTRGHAQMIPIEATHALNSGPSRCYPGQKARSSFLRTPSLPTVAPHASARWHKKDRASPHRRLADAGSNQGAYLTLAATADLRPSNPRPHQLPLSILNRDRRTSQMVDVRVDVAAPVRQPERYRADALPLILEPLQHRFE